MNKEKTSLVSDLFDAVTAVALGFLIMGLGFLASAGLLGLFGGVCVNVYRFVTGD